MRSKQLDKICVSFGLMALIGMSFWGCQDKSTSEYAICVQLNIKGDIGGAWDACNAAISANPISQSGKAAAEKLAEIKPKYDEWKQTEMVGKNWTDL